MKTTLDVWEGVPFDCGSALTDQRQARLRGHCQQVNGRTIISRVAGHLQLDSGLRIRIRSPKAEGAAILAWASFCDPTLRALGSLTALPLAGTAADVGSVLAKTFSQNLLQATTRSGLHRHYSKKNQRSLALRGRINFPARSHRRTCSRWSPTAS